MRPRLCPNGAMRTFVSCCLTLPKIFAIFVGVVVAMPIARAEVDTKLISDRYETRQWGVRDGLPAATVTGISQDDDGFVWVATFGGVARFDGREFVRVIDPKLDTDGNRFTSIQAIGPAVFVTTFSNRAYRIARRGLSVTEVNVPMAAPNRGVHVAATPDGHLLLLGSGVLTYDAFSRTWTKTYDVKDDWAKKILWRDDGTVWILGQFSLQCVSGVCPSTTVHRRALMYSFADTNDGILVSSTKGIERLAGNTLSPAAGNDPSEVTLASTSDSVWLASATSLTVTSMASKRTQAVELRLPKWRLGLKKDARPIANVLFEDRRGGVWLGTGNFGLFHIHDRMVEHVDFRSGFEGLSTLSIAPTPTGALVSTYCGGIQAVATNHESDERVTTKRIAAPVVQSNACVNALLVGQKSSLVGAVNDVVKLHDDGATVVFSGAENNLSPVLSMHSSGDGGLWLGTASSGLKHIRPHSAPETAPRISPSTRLRFRAQQRGATVESANRLSRPTDFADAFTLDANIAVSISGMPVAITSLYGLDERRLLLGTTRGIRLLEDGRVRKLKSTVASREVPIRHLTVDDGGNLWATSYGGGVLFVPRRDFAGNVLDAGPAPATAAGRWLQKGNGFCHDFVSAMVVTEGTETTSPRVWFNSNAGVFWVLTDELLAHATTGARLPCRFLDTSEGNGGAMPAGGLLDDGRLIFPTVEGPVIIDPNDIPDRSTRTSAQPWIESLLVDGASVDFRSPRTVFPPGNRDLSMAFIAPTFGPAPLSVFEVTLSERSGAKRVLRGGSRQVFSRLPPGTYSLEVRHIDAEGALSLPRQLEFKLSAAWYERSAFKVGGPIVLLLAIFAFIWGWARILRARSRLLANEEKERKKKEAANEERDALYRAAFESSAVPLLVFAPSGELVDANIAAEAFTSVSPSGDRILLHQSEDERVHFERVIRELARLPSMENAPPASNFAAPKEFVLDTPTEKRVVHVASVPFSIGGEPRLLVTLVDLTQERRAERERARHARRTEATKRLEGLGRISAGIAHDFNNVLAALTLQVQAIEADKLQDPEVMEDIAESIDWGRALTARLLAGKGRAHVSPHVVETSVTDALLALAPTDRAFIEHTKKAGVATAALSTVEVRQLVTNLVMNAIQATDGNAIATAASSGQSFSAPTPRIHVFTEVSSSPDELPPEFSDLGEGVIVHPIPEGPMVTIRVVDNGPGIEPDMIASIFEPFFSKKMSRGGTGIGLTTVFEIVRARQGGLCVHSRPGHGACFSVAFPFAAVDATTARATPNAGRANRITDDNPVVQFDAPGPLILICDDQETIRKGLTLALTRAGATTLEAKDGQEALDLYEAHREEINGVITDYLMPRINGLELIDALRSDQPALPILLISGFLDDDAIVKHLPDDVHRLQKPVDPFALCVEVKTLLELHQAETGRTPSTS